MRKRVEGFGFEVLVETTRIFLDVLFEELAPRLDAVPAIGRRSVDLNRIPNTHLVLPRLSYGLGTRQSCSVSILFGQLNRLDCHFTLDARIPGDLHRAETARTSCADWLVTIEYEFGVCHSTFHAAISVRFGSAFFAS